MAHLIPLASGGFPVDVTAETTLRRPLGVVKFAMLVRGPEWAVSVHHRRPNAWALDMIPTSSRKLAARAYWEE